MINGHGFHIRDYLKDYAKLQEGPLCPLLRVAHLTALGGEMGEFQNLGTLNWRGRPYNEGSSMSGYTRGHPFPSHFDQSRCARYAQKGLKCY